MPDASLLSDGQVTALVGAIVSGAAGVGAVIKWCAGRIVRALDRNSETSERHAQELVRLGERVDRVTEWVDFHRREDETPLHPMGPEERRGDRRERERVKTPVRGVATEYSHVKRRDDER